MFAVLNLLKPQGMTSHDVVSVVRRAYGLRRVGHGGTLDPMADGVLPVYLGSAARLIEYACDDKAYRLSVRFGQTSDTLDAEGQVTQSARPEDARLAVTEDAVKAALSAMTGVIEQRIPAYSAKRVNGKKLYELARAGMLVENQTKTVRLEALSLMALTQTPEGWPLAEIEVTCGAGAFMRAIARDLGETLGCGALLSGLTRLRHGRFLMSDAVALEALRAHEDPARFLLDPLPYLDLPRWNLPDASQAALLRQGMPLEAPELPAPLRKMRDKDMCALTQEGRLVAIARWRDRKLRPEKVFEEAVADGQRVSVS